MASTSAAGGEGDPDSEADGQATCSFGLKACCAASWTRNDQPCAMCCKCAIDTEAVDHERLREAFKAGTSEEYYPGAEEDAVACDLIDKGFEALTADGTAISDVGTRRARLDAHRSAVGTPF